MRFELMLLGAVSSCGTLTLGYSAVFGLLRVVQILTGKGDE